MTFHWRDGAETRSSVRFYRMLCESEWTDRAAIEACTVERLRDLVVHAATHVPHYRETFAQHAVGAAIHSLDDFRRLPPLPRRTFQEQWSEFRAESLPPGMRETNVVHTSGTSGIPVQVRQTNAVQTAWLAFHLRDLAWSGIDPRGRLAAIRYTVSGPGEPVSSPTWENVVDRLIETGPSLLCDIHEDPHRQIELLRDFGPDYLLSYPSNLLALSARLSGGAGGMPGLRVVKSVSEELCEADRQLIESSFGASVRNLYSCFEAGYLASSCPTGEGLHVHAENVFLEVLDDAGRPAGPGEVGDVVITTLLNYANPLIRYRIGDRAALLPPCPCGRGLPLLAPPLGKIYPNFLLPDGRQKNTMGLAVAMRKCGGFHQFQIVQTATDAATVRIVPDSTWNDDRAAAVRRAVSDFFEAHVRLRLDVTDRIQPDRGGKVRSLICTVKGSDASSATLRSGVPSPFGRGTG